MAAPSPGSLNEDETTLRVGWTVAVSLLLLFGFQNWGTGGAMSLAVWVAVINTVVSLTLAAWIWVRPVHRAIPLIAMVVLSLTSLGVAASQLSTASGYGTDSMAFNEYAAALLLDGENPYAQTMAPALTEYRVPPTNTTLTFEGEFVTDLSYPAGSFLFYAGALAAGVDLQAAPLVNAVAWLASLWLMFALLPRRHAWVAVVFGSASAFAGLSAAGLNDVLFLPFMLLALYRWDRWVDRSLPLTTRLLAPVALGIACSIKQTPWFTVPILTLGVIMSAPTVRPGVHRATGYLAVVVSTFLVINLPFIVSDPSAWLHGISLPLLQPLIVDGQGIVSLATLTGLGGGNVQLFTIAGALAYLALALAMVGFFDIVKRCWLPLLALVLILPARSLAIYAAMWAPVMVIAAVTVTPPRGRLPVRKAVGWVSISTAGLATVIAVAALLWRAPFEIAVVDAKVSDDGRISSLTIDITNRASQQKRALMTLNAGGQPTQVWSQDAQSRDPLLVEARSTLRTEIFPVTSAGRPSQASLIRVQAFTTGPRSVSVSPQWGPAVQGPKPGRSDPARSELLGAEARPAGQP